MEIKDFLQKTAEKYNARITFPDLHIEDYEPQKVVAEITNFQGEPRIHLVSQKVDCRIEIEMELEKLGIDYIMNSSFNPDKLTVTIKEEK